MTSKFHRFYLICKLVKAITAIYVDSLEAWLERPLDAYYPILYIDCTFVAVRRDAMVRKEAFYTVLGVRPDRTREVLSLVNTPTESSTGCQQIVQ